MLSPADTEAIERATLAAVSPPAIDALDGWLLPFDDGTVRRARSAVPMRHAPASGALVPAIAERYAARGLQAAFRVPDDACFDGFRDALAAHGYSRTQPTLVMTAPVAAMRAVSVLAPADIDGAPDAAWAALFVGEGFDPVDGASRVKALSRSPGTVYASVRENGRTLAAGAGAFGQGWASVHGMRTELAQRGQGHAGRVLAAIAQVAMQRGHERVFLQVEEANAAAISLYRRAGFERAWLYEYWS